MHNIKKSGGRHASQVVGRGGKRGKTSGRGTKGQKARAGRKIRPEIRDVIMRVPKLRGYRFKSRYEKSVPVNLELIERLFNEGDIVDPDSLRQKGVVTSSGGVMPHIKILSKGELTKKVKFSGVSESHKAKEKIEKAGGTILK